MKKELLFVDGYNMIGSWPHLVKLQRQDDMAAARDTLLHELSEYAKYEQVEVRVVFDAHFVPGIQKQYDRYNLTVIFTKEDETADSYIEKAVGEENLYTTNVVVATSDLAEQWLIFQRGASRKSARDLYKELKHTKQKIAIDTRDYNIKNTRRIKALSEDQEEQLRKFMEDLNG
ncbi:MAG TPA: NYN domain-containing protein [Atopostipes sp.]|nr:NYN domain-containing protein [Atopostipes sp.]